MMRLHLLLVPGLVLTSVSMAGDDVADLMNATFKVVNKDSTATGFVLVSPLAPEAGQQELILVSAAHVFEKMSGDECRIVLREQQPAGRFRRKEVALTIRSNGKPLWVRHPDVDIAALKFALPADQSVPGLPVDALVSEPSGGPDSVRCADDVWIPGYPARLESGPAGFPILRRGTVASFPLAPVRERRTYMVAANTFGGDSGAPVFKRRHVPATERNQSPLVVGLIVGLHRETTKTVAPDEERTVHRPLGLAIAVHSVFIRQTVDLLLDVGKGD